MLLLIKFGNEFSAPDHIKSPPVIIEKLINMMSVHTCILTKAQNEISMAHSDFLQPTAFHVMQYNFWKMLAEFQCNTKFMECR